MQKNGGKPLAGFEEAPAELRAFLQETAPDIQWTDRKIARYLAFRREGYSPGQATYKVEFSGGWFL